ncbi:MAG TPA: rhodanese family protein [Hyphomicrobium sp.]|nr:rhodanese family protein [Hyphomicrobium sp.]
MSAMKKISPRDAKALIDKGAVLVDIREADERARAQIAGSEHMPLSKLGSLGDAPTGKGQVVVFHCKSGNRTLVNADKLAAKTECEAYILDGGIDAWTAAGLPVATAAKKPPIEIIRQVMIVAGSMALAGVLLGMYVSPVWFYLSAFVGLGLIFSGVTGFCLMAYMLKRMPWNRGYA